MLRISGRIQIPDTEIDIQAVRSPGAGGQHVNKVATGVQLRFDIHASSLPDAIKRRLAAWPDQRISRDGVVVIKATEYRSRERNRQAALSRLRTLVARAATPAKVRRPTRPARRARIARTDSKVRHGRKKQLRRPPPKEE